MTELTYEEWQKNPTPRMMWVWDSKVEDKVKRKVIYFNDNKDVFYPVVVLSSDGIYIISYKHCAEIEKQRRMTNKELSRWLREKPTRECKCTSADYIYSVLTYEEDCADDEVEDILIREDDSEWREPFVEVEE